MLQGNNLLHTDTEISLHAILVKYPIWQVLENEQWPIFYLTESKVLGIF